jgi:hypothetical protein
MRNLVLDSSNNPIDPKSNVLTHEKEKVIVAFLLHNRTLINSSLNSFKASLPH